MTLSDGSAMYTPFDIKLCEKGMKGVNERYKSE